LNGRRFLQLVESSSMQRSAFKNKEYQILTYFIVEVIKASSPHPSITQYALDEE
jgi:hypothetical protein